MKGCKIYDESMYCISKLKKNIHRGSNMEHLLWHLYGFFICSKGIRFSCSIVKQISTV